jgi:hypothetical protein
VRCNRSVDGHQGQGAKRSMAQDTHFLHNSPNPGAI